MSDASGPPEKQTVATPILQVERLHKAFGGLVVLKDVGIDVNQGEVHGLIGPNGAGKTTLFSIVHGTMRADGGDVRFRGQRISRMRVDERCKLGLGRTFQVPKPFGRLTVIENVLVGATFGSRSLGRKSRSERRHLTDVADAALDRVGMSDLARTEARELSLGHLKLLELARALATGPDLLMLDEIMAGLNESDVDRISSQLSDLNRDGISLLLVDHVMKAVMALSDRISVLNEGHIIRTGTPDEVSQDERVIKAYLGSTAHAA